MTLALDFAPEIARVVGRVQETRETFTLELELGRPFLFSPGQFNMLYAHGVGEVAISISGDPARPERLVHTIRTIGRVTECIARLGVGDSIGVRGPFGQGFPIEGALGQDLVFVAGGLGLAPLRPAVLAVLKRRKQYGRVALLVGTRRPEDRLFPRELAAWEQAGIQVISTVDQASPSWTGDVGVVPPLLRELTFDPQNAWVFVCGPEVMMRFCERELSRLGLPSSRLILSLERSMKCGVGLCGHCQLGPYFVCKDGPVVNYEKVRRFLLLEGA